MTPTEIIEKFGGIRKMAQIMGYAPSTVHNWHVRESIPAPQQGIILHYSNLHGIGLSAEDFIQIPKKLPKRKTQNEDRHKSFKRVPEENVKCN